ncbi:hypothetical protein I4F81_005523 [Pyropia yezoensis]|uniref:Uncharacterized protein n=1 Tax=Pyropia yezoensis TaxID=2788 RepID=A0ACC3BYI3_PYRYE|nr:hypothetical protein I4F81_005523 [Neopyropia yezoensis]
MARSQPPAASPLRRLPLKRHKRQSGAVGDGRGASRRVCSASTVANGFFLSRAVPAPPPPAPPPALPAAAAAANPLAAPYPASAGSTPPLAAPRPASVPAPSGVPASRGLGHCQADPPRPPAAVASAAVYATVVAPPTWRRCEPGTPPPARPSAPPRHPAHTMGVDAQPLLVAPPPPSHSLCSTVCPASSLHPRTTLLPATCIVDADGCRGCDGLTSLNGTPGGCVPGSVCCGGGGKRVRCEHPRPGRGRMLGFGGAPPAWVQRRSGRQLSSVTSLQAM